MITKKIIMTAFCGVLLTSCGGDNQASSKTVVATAEVVAKVAEKKIEKEAAPEKKSVEKVVEKKTTIEDAEKIAAAKERQMLEVKMIVSSAKGAMSNAAQVGFEWTIWKKMIAKAEAALKEGDAEKAAKISYKIIKQSDAALKQSIAAEKAGPRF